MSWDLKKVHLFCSYHVRGIYGAAWSEVFFAWLKGVANDSDGHTPRRTHTCVWTVLQSPKTHD